MINAYFFYKISHQLYNWKIPFLPQLIKLFIFLVYNSSIPYQCKIGSGTRFAYNGIGVVLHKRAVIGKNCMIGTQVTIGGKTPHYEVPIIGDDVQISTGAKILGPLRIGSRSIIGANAVVVKNVEEATVVGGVPAKLIKRIFHKN